MSPVDKMIARLGNEPPIVADGRKGPPDRREISARWLSGTFLTGLTSIVLMGVALSAALDGRQLLATPAELMVGDQRNIGDSDATGKSARVASTVLSLKEADKRVLQVSTLSKVGDRNVVRTLPFGFVNMSLAAGHTTKKSYAPFNAITMFADTGDKGAGIEAAQIYGAKVESEVSLATIAFDVVKQKFNTSNSLTLEEVEEAVRISGTTLTDGDVQVASLHYIDPLRFGASDYELGLANGVKIVQENVTVTQRQPPQQSTIEFAEEILPIRSDAPPAILLKSAGFIGADARDMAVAITTLLSAPTLKAGWALRIGFETRADIPRIVRASIYDGKTHLFTIAVDDQDQFVPTEAPDSGEDVIAALSNEPRPTRVRGELPTIYDGIYRAAYAYDLTPRMSKQLIKMLASEVDFQARLSPTDALKVFYSIPEGFEKATDESDILFVDARFSGNSTKYYRYRDGDGIADYFDEDGNSSQQFLLRKTVPQGEMRSSFGMRRHPILGYVRLHAGTDWAAPRGTPIIAAGSGIVETAGWSSSGYGKQTIIKHANGYVSSYSHQNSISPGVAPGARVRQGQIIGTVGSTGLSTGPHLHYELIINGAKVDSMRVRLPSGKSLQGPALAAFKKERKRIDALLAAEVAPQKIASN